jgi:hypothetical protein
LQSKKGEMLRNCDQSTIALAAKLFLAWLKFAARDDGIRGFAWGYGMTGSRRQNLKEIVARMNSERGR